MERKRMLCADTLQGMLLALRNFPGLRREFQARMLALLRVKKQEYSEERKMEYNRALITKVICIINLMNWIRFEREDSVRIFLRETMNAGNINEGRATRNVEIYVKKERLFREQAQQGLITLR